MMVTTMRHPAEAWLSERSKLVAKPVHLTEMVGQTEMVGSDAHKTSAQGDWSRYLHRLRTKARRRRAREWRALARGSLSTSWTRPSCGTARPGPTRRIRWRGGRMKACRCSATKEKGEPSQMHIPAEIESPSHLCPAAVRPLPPS